MDQIESKEKKGGCLKYFFYLLIIPALLIALYTWATLKYVYSDGERVGYVQKLSQKGFLCKTFEGELLLVSMPGTVGEKTLFTVPDAAVAKQIDAAAGKRVSLHYNQHIGVPTTCFGETQYFVDGVKVLD